MKMRIQKQNLDGLTKAITEQTDMRMEIKNQNNENEEKKTKTKFKLPEVCHDDPYIVKIYRSLLASTGKQAKKNSTESKE